MAFDYEYINPIIKVTPQDAFYAEKISKKIIDSEGEVSGEFIMCYPPGILILAPGELVTKEAIDCIVYSREKGCLVTGTEDMKIENIKVLKL